MNWYYLENGQQRGPVSDTEFPALVQNGTILPDTYLWCDGMAEWKPYRELMAAPVAAPTPSATSSPVVTTPTSGGLRIRREEQTASATEREAACSHCGSMVPVSQLTTLGASQLCPKCQASQRQLSFTATEGAMDYANPAVRLVAFVLDGIICFSVAAGGLWGAMLLLKQARPDPTVATLAVFGIGACLLLWILNYFVGKIARDGATPMMNVFRLKVVTANRAPVGVGRALGRWLLIGLINQFTFGLGHVVALFDKQRRALHDMVCGTFVIKT